MTFYPRDATPKFIQRPRYWAGGIGIIAFVLDGVLTDPVLFERTYDTYHHVYPIITQWLQIVIGSAWLFLYEIPLIWKKEKCENLVCWICGYHVRGIMGDTCPECGFNEVKRGIEAAKRTYGFCWLVGPSCRLLQTKMKRNGSRHRGG